MKYKHIRFALFQKERKNRLFSGLFALLFCLGIVNAFGQQEYTISGVVTDLNTGETLIGVNVLIPELRAGVITNAYGFYSITLPQGAHELIYSTLGYTFERRSIELNASMVIDVALGENAEELDEVVIKADVEALDITTPQMSVNSLTAQTIKNIPVVLGEADVIKSLLLLPGVSNAGEGASGFNVRGGAVDQNLILLDEATIFNSSHLFGFFSVFNPDAIKDLKLYKGSIPARYGSRVSSVLDIYQKEGNSKNFKMSGGIGAVASRLLVEGPIKKDQAAFLVGGRGSYAHLFLPLFDIENTAYFYDLNTKINYKIDDSNSLYLSGYFGRDYFGIQDSFINSYGNAVINFRWNHNFSDKLFSNLSLIYSNYYYGLELDFVGFKWDSGIENFNLKYDFNHYLSKGLQLNYGLQNIYYGFNPGKIIPNRPDSGIVADQLTQKYANEAALYIDVEWEISQRLRAEVGLRGSHFMRFGQDEFQLYANDAPVTFDPFLLIYKEADPIETIRVDRWERLKTYSNWEPRIAASYTITDDISLKASYTKLSQYLHLLSNTSSPTPLDVWTPSGPYVKPQRLDQYAVGVFSFLKDRAYSLEVEAYYKDVRHRIDYIDGANLIANNAIEQVILDGNARAYGLEVLLRKNQGAFQGWIAYTLSKSEQKTSPRNENEIGINNGQWYNTPYDKPHDLSIYGTYTLNDRWKINSNFIYQTGLPTNYPIGQFDFQGIVVPYYGLRNEQRLPDYHRIDLSATYTPKRKSNALYQSEWVFSIYNVYNRMNAASINFRQNADTGVNEAVRTSIFGLVPAVTYNFKF
ncbi:MAG: TonB-dependent receptor [Flavobacteriaceae bacterium]|nr:TonB-dependent receptor [Flavobacteriaceae bacterium]